MNTLSLIFISVLLVSLISLGGVLFLSFRFCNRRALCKRIFALAAGSRGKIGESHSSLQPCPWGNCSLADSGKIHPLAPLPFHRLPRSHSSTRYTHDHRRWHP